MTRNLSLRMRLTLIILLPLLAISVAAGLWQLNHSRQTATEVFDRSLLTAALAVSNDVSLSGGDALSPRTQKILSDTSGGRVFYHVYAPDGVIVAGYATPPVGIPAPDAKEAGPSFFSAIYFGRPVSGVRLQSRTEIDGFSGVFTTTVWQDTALREAFVRDLIRRSLITIGGLIIALALVVWFGVRLGLRPLLDLQDAIERRSSDELSPIRRPVPEEVRGIVETLNQLFAQLSRSMAAQSDFISNAAHQMRNPIAGVLALAEAVHRAPSPEAARTRAEDLLEAARETADLTQKLLTLERAKAISPLRLHHRVDLQTVLAEWATGYHDSMPPGVDLDLTVRADPGQVRCDPTMLREALSNLVDNAVRHGGPSLSRVTISAERSQGQIRLTVTDDGCGIPTDEIPAAKERFAQLSASSGSGLGLPIVEAIAASHGGELHVTALSPGLQVTICMPVETAAG